MTDTPAGFWQRCVAAECVVVPVRTYSEYGQDGNLDQALYTGVLYAALRSDLDVVGPDYYLQVEDGQTGLDRLYATPEDALTAAEARQRRAR